MKKGMKGLLAAALVLALAGGCGFGGWRIYQSYHGGTVEVFSLENLTTTYWGDETQTEGLVTTEALQTEYLSETQSVEKVLVKEGQRVKKGDVLFTYDSTLSDLDYKRKELEVQQKALEREQAQKQLRVIRTYKAGVPIPGSKPHYEKPKPVKPGKPEVPTYPGLRLISDTDKGTAKVPYSYFWKDDFFFNDELLAAAMQGKDDAYVRFYLKGKVYTPPTPAETGGNAQQPTPPDEDDSPYYSSWVMHCQHTNTGYRYVMTAMNIGGPYGFDREVGKPFDPLTEAEKPQTEEDFGWDDFDGGFGGIVYTGAEISAMLREAEQAVKDADIECRKLELEARKLEREVNNSEVCSELDGVVTLLNDSEGLEQGTPLLKVSGGGGYIVKGTISELDMDSVAIGQSVTISSWMTGDSYTGTVDSISDYPTSGNGYWGDGNRNVSYYSFNVSVSDEANLQEGDYVELRYTATADGAQNSYLMKSFVRSEDGKSYVYADNGGTLEKRYVTTGRDLWGSYVEIKSGLDGVTHLAFPYGQRVHEKAPTTEGSMESLYGY